jgi:cell division protein FtsN
VAQLASFRSQSEATAEFGRLKAKYGSTLGGVSPVISQAEVAGSTRYRLAVGPFASRDAANAMCSKLFAAGERDCLVRN